jgi:hypothetical protein
MEICTEPLGEGYIANNRLYTAILCVKHLYKEEKDFFINRQQPSFLTDYMGVYKRLFAI